MMKAKMVGGPLDGQETEIHACGPLAGMTVVRPAVVDGATYACRYDGTSDGVLKFRDANPQKGETPDRDDGITQDPYAELIRELRKWRAVEKRSSRPLNIAPPPPSRRKYIVTLDTDCEEPCEAEVGCVRAGVARWLAGDYPVAVLPPGWRLQAVDGQADVEVVPNRLKLRVGTLEADLDAAGVGRVTLDGQPVPMLRVLTVRTEVGKQAEVTLDVVPVKQWGEPLPAEMPELVICGMKGAEAEFGNPLTAAEVFGKPPVSDAPSPTPDPRLGWLGEAVAMSGGQVAPPCPQGHHEKEGPCRDDYCRCDCPRCRTECAYEARR